MNTLTQIKQIINEYKWNALTYVQQILEYSCKLEEVDFDPATDEMKSCYTKDDLFFVLNENPKQFTIKIFQGKKQLFRKVELI